MSQVLWPWYPWRKPGWSLWCFDATWFKPGCCDQFACSSAFQISKHIFIKEDNQYVFMFFFVLSSATVAVVSEAILFGSTHSWKHSCWVVEWNSFKSTNKKWSQLGSLNGCHSVFWEIVRWLRQKMDNVSNKYLRTKGRKDYNGTPGIPWQTEKIVPLFWLMVSVKCLCGSVSLSLKRWELRNK